MPSPLRRRLPVGKPRDRSEPGRDRSRSAINGGCLRELGPLNFDTYDAVYDHINASVASSYHLKVACVP
jgi:hypothetical protein